VRRHHREPVAVVGDFYSAERRLQKAIEKDDYQEACRLAGMLSRRAGGENYRAELIRLTLAYVGRLLTHNRHGSALSELTSLLPVLTDSPLRKEVAIALARCGDLANARSAAGSELNDALEQTLLSHVVDVVVAGNPAAHPKIPPDLGNQIDALQRAFAQAREGQDDEARATLQAIGLTSPLLEWKLLLRGLIAYWSLDDTKALENWQRLSVERLPGRIAAPFRAAIDRTFREAQAPITQKHLKSLIAQTEGDPIGLQIKALASRLGTKRELGGVLRALETLLPAIKNKSPDLVPRLARVLFWEIVGQGHADLATAYKRCFGAPPEDPDLCRLAALAAENLEDQRKTEALWLKYEASLAANAHLLPRGRANAIRALIWRRLADRADLRPQRDPADIFFSPFFANRRETRSRLQFDAAACLAKAIALAPDDVETYLQVLKRAIDGGDDSAILRAAETVLARFPDEPAALEAAADACLDDHDHARGLPYLTRAAKVKPLDTALRAKISQSYLWLAISSAGGKKKNSSPQAMEQALALADTKNKPLLLVVWAALARKGGDAASAAERLAQARATPMPALWWAYVSLVGAQLVKSAAPVKAEALAEFRAQLAVRPPDAEGLLITLGAAAEFQENGPAFVGQKSYIGSLLACANELSPTELIEERLAEMCQKLAKLGAKRVIVDRWLNLAKLQFPDNPRFAIIEFWYLRSRDSMRDQWASRYVLDRARVLVEGYQGPDRASLHLDLEAMRAELVEPEYDDDWFDDTPDVEF
jgi:hypothetical protein